MPVCPKCGFAGQDPDTCERCGIIYARMHAQLDARIQTPVSNKVVAAKPRDLTPATGLQMMAIPTPVRPSPAVTGAPNTPAAMSRAPVAIERTPTPVAHGSAEKREVTLIPIVPPTRERSRLPWLVGVLVVALLGWGLSQWHIARSRSRAGQQQDSTEEDADYYDLAVGSLVQDAMVQFKHVTDPVALEKSRKSLFDRRNRLLVQIATAPMSDAHRAALNDALDNVGRFLKSQEPHADAPGTGVVAASANASKSTAAGATSAPPGAAAGTPAAGTSAVPVPSAAHAAVDLSLLKQANSILGAHPP